MKLLVTGSRWCVRCSSAKGRFAFINPHHPGMSLEPRAVPLAITPLIPQAKVRIFAGPVLLTSVTKVELLGLLTRLLVPMAGGGVGGGEGDFYPTNDPHLPTDHPQCMNKTCRAFEEGWRLSEEEIPFLTQLEYGKWTVYFYAFWIFLFAVRHWYRRFREYFVVPHAELRRSRPSRAQRITAAWRFWIYRRLGGRLMSLELPPYGTLALLTLSTVFMGVSPFVEEPYLRTLFRFGSPPLSVRCAMIISALTPLVVALAGKVNLVTILTGICYSKLNIFHRYSACVLFYLSTVHTVWLRTRMGSHSEAKTVPVDTSFDCSCERWRLENVTILVRREV